MNELFVRGVRLSRPLPEENWLCGVSAVRVLRQMERLDFSVPVTFFVGENGVGKSTLLEGIAVALGFNPEGGTVNFRFSTCDTHSSLAPYLTVEKGPYRHRDGFFLRAESFYNAASYLDQLDRIAPSLGAYGGVSLHQQSHGESFLSLLINKFIPKGLYLLDEPEAALSPMRQLSMLYRMGELVRGGAQFLISTHSPILMAMPGAQVLELSNDGIRPTPYEQTEHFALSKRFLNAPEKMLRQLFEEEDTH